MTQRAMVVDGDAQRLRTISGGLRLFRPGFRVVTSGSLEDATGWLSTEPPDILLVGLGAISADELKSWMERNGVPLSRVIALVGEAGAETEEFGAVLRDGCGLSEILTVVRSMTTWGEVREHQNLEMTRGVTK